MSTQSQDLADGRELAACDRDDDETLEMAIAQAFGRVGIDVMERETPFHEMVNVDALRDLHEESRATPIRTTLTLYDHPVTITSEEVRIYAASAGDE
ncbi:hypothetical protein ACFQL0_05680 [Haloplanus litoreus]|uniref:hypothetical protein n=1 Tax=Haloplanus litoreus TaxID=767515 RepID=UPI0036209E8D